MEPNTKRKVTMIEANDTEVKVQQNTIDIKIIQQDLKSIRNNHLKHIEEDMAKIDKKVDRIDTRLWTIMIMVAGSAVANYFM